VAHPLERLRSSIRLYVAAEGLAWLIIYLALWFWIGLLLDYGFFKAFTIDWVQELPRSLRVAVLSVLAAGLAALIVLKLARRLFREFRASALALVLERRFPQLLGDRLITAVELADPRKSEEYGYSQAMVDQTINDAAERVDQLEIKEVFDWKRLQTLGYRIIALTLGGYLVAGAVHCAYTRTADLGGFAGRFNDVAVIWFERNILLLDTIWPRRAHLELLDFPGDEIRVGRDASPPILRVRALKWIIADSNREKAPEGWRALTWADLTDDLLGAPVPRAALPGDWHDWTIDQIELQLDKPEVINALEGETVERLRGVLFQLHDRAASRQMSRRLRQLDIPETVEVLYRGATIRSEQTLPPGINHEYSGTVSNLRESLRFTVRGEDYYTLSKRIVVVPPPTLVELTVVEAQPAYLHQRVPSDGKPEDLRGKKQMFSSRPVSLTGEKSSILVPAGTDLVIMGKTDKALKSGGVRFLPYKPGGPEVQFPAIEQQDDHNFQVKFANVTALADFYFEFTDTDNVLGKRHVEVKPVHDTAPEVDVQPEVIRKASQGYMVTPEAMIPFSGKVRDDRGLAAVEYVYTKELVETPTSGSRLALAASVPGLLQGDLGRAMFGMAVLGLLAQPAAAAQGEKLPERIALSSFERAFKEDAQKALTVAKLEQALRADPGKGTLLKDFELDPDFETFAVSRLRLKPTDEKAVQPHYRLRLWVAATDNNVEREEKGQFAPGVGLSKEKFTILVVSENELLAEIAKEEEGLHVKLEEALNRLKDARLKLDKIMQELPELKPDEFSPMARRAEEIQEADSKSWDTSREVYTDYRRILKELKANQVRPGMINKVNDKICEPLEAAINVDFVQADEAIREFQKKLDEKVASEEAAKQAREALQKLGVPTRERLDKLIARLSDILDNMGDITTINKLITTLLAIEKKERAEHDRLKEILRKREEDLLNGKDK
jgi:hypothetical protein